MATTVITVGPDATVQDVAKLLLGKRISAVPVVGNKGELLGIVSEGDLINRSETKTRHRKSWWFETFASKDTFAAEYIKSNSKRAVDVMTREVITASPETPVAEIAALLEKNKIKRVPIVSCGRIVGIVSRADLLHGLVSLKGQALHGCLDDSSIRSKLLAKLGNERWLSPASINITVQDGVVELSGVVESEREKEALQILAEVTPGVRAVNGNLMVLSPTYYGWM